IRDFHVTGVQTCALPISWRLNSTGYLVMDPEGERRPNVVDVWSPSDDAHFKPYDGCDILPAPDKTFVFNFESCSDSYGIRRWVRSEERRGGEDFRVGVSS